MQFSFSFIVHFALSLAGFICLGIYLCRGSWRNSTHRPLAFALLLIITGHLWGGVGTTATVVRLALIALFAVQIILAWWHKNFVPSEVRGGHNALSIMVGVALFALAIQLHGALIGVPVFSLVK